MKDLNLVIAAILTDANQEDLNSIQLAVQDRRNTLSRHNRYIMRAGQAVTFKHKGVVYSGKIKSIKLKKAIVETILPNSRAYDSKMRSVPATINYNVPLSMLEAA